MREYIVTLIILLALLTWAFFRYALPKYKVLFDKSTDSLLTSEELKDKKGKRFRSVFWPVFLLLLCVFLGVRITNSVLEKDLVERLNALPVNVQEYLKGESTAPSSKSEELEAVEEWLEEAAAKNHDYEYYVELPDGKRSILTQKDYDQIKDNMFAQFPEAKVTRRSKYDPNDNDILVSDQFDITLPDGRSTLWNAEQMGQAGKSLIDKYPDAVITKLQDEAAIYWEEKYKKSRINVAYESGNENTAFLDLLDDGRTETWSLEEYNTSSRRFFVKYPSAVVVRMDLPPKYTWEIGVTSIKAPLLNLSISATVNHERDYGNDIWLKEDEIAADYLSYDIIGKLHRKKIGDVHALTVTDQWEKREVMKYDYFIDFFSQGKWISIDISGDEQHFRNFKQFEDLAIQVQKSMRIITY